MVHHSVRRPADLPVAVLGLVVVALGLAALVACFVQFVREGRGTPAPIAPTEELVVGGLYRWVRNPMYLAVGAMILGQAVAFASVGVLAGSGCSPWLWCRSWRVRAAHPAQDVWPRVRRILPRRARVVATAHAMGWSKRLVGRDPD